MIWAMHLQLIVTMTCYSAIYLIYRETILLYGLNELFHPLVDTLRRTKPQIDPVSIRPGPSGLEIKPGPTFER